MEILNQSPIMEMDPSYASLGVKILIATIIGLVTTFICAVCGGNISMAVTGGFTILCLVILFSVVGLSPEVPTDRNEYIVKIDDDVSFVEIYEKYEVIERKGDIWILQDREVEE